MRFMGKSNGFRVVKRVSNRALVNSMQKKEAEREAVEDKTETVETTKKNNKTKTSKKMDLKTLEKIENAVGVNNVKVEKKDKGLFERTDNSKVILTEDNKMLLND